MPDLQPLYNWFETDGWDSIADSQFNEEVAIPFSELFKTEFNDLALSEYDGIDLSDIKVEARLDRARYLIEESIEDYPSVHFYRLLQVNKDSPVICCLATLEDHSQPKWVWFFFKNHRLLLII